VCVTIIYYLLVKLIKFFVSFFFYHSIYIASYQLRWTKIFIKEIRLKRWPLAPRLSRHSRLSQPTRIDPPPMTSYYNSIATMGLSRTISEINGDFSRKSPIFLSSVYSNAPRKGFPWNWVSALSVNKKKTRIDVATGPRKKFDDSFSRLNNTRTWQTDKGRDGRTDGHQTIAKTALTQSVAR